MRKQLDESISDALKKLGQLKLGHLIYGKDWKPETKTFKERLDHIKGAGYPEWMQRLDDWLAGKIDKYHSDYDVAHKNTEEAYRIAGKEWEKTKAALNAELDKATDPSMKKEIRKVYQEMERTYQKITSVVDKSNEEMEKRDKEHRKTMEKLKRQ